MCPMTTSMRHNLMRHDRSRSLLLVAAVLLFSGCGAEDSSRVAGTDDLANGSESITVVATSYPVFVMASEIVGDECEVVFPAADATSPQAWKTSAKDISVLQSADLILLNGAGYEAWAQQVSLPRSRTVETSAAYESKLKRVQDSVSHQHGPAGENTGGDLLWATWLDPQLATLQLKAIEGALSKVVPDQRAAFAARGQTIADRLAKLDQQIEQLAAATAEKEMVVLSVGSEFEYLTARLGWSVRWLPESVDSARLNETLVDFADAESASKLNILLHTSSLISPLREAAAEHGFRAVEIDQCDQPIAERSVWDRLQGNIERLSHAAGS
ncbi:putative zinc transport system zinc-binding lipoprotein AdcA precursor [Fuerstiella marisgermanici]|uniref:Putative zinc transport system zinc-binding lipoprotein AdcA n=2 Tax=Fuerstiella marisgermanici TaxID=1891926 RepID=A0A1P8WSE7_9PLAN|nr:putative zinc transport system zinc-binding lipoprotein AdcA precursor [Fuerstiella marisgermanici]